MRIPRILIQLKTKRMKIVLIYCFVFCLSMQAYSQYFPIDTTRLNNSYKELLQLPLTLEKEKAFLDAFPSTFAELTMVYQYIPDPNYDLTMFHKTNDHFYEGLAKLHLIPDFIYCDKLINLCLDGRYDFSGVGSQLRDLIGNLLIGKLDIMLECLHEKEYNQQFSFWYFFFLNRNLMDDIRKLKFPDLKELMNNKYPKDIKIMETAYDVSNVERHKYYPDFPHLEKKLKGQDPSLIRENMYREDARRRGFYYNESKCDTLLVEDKMFFFKQTPINHFKGFMNLFTSEEVITMMGQNGKSYYVTWVIKNKQLYLDHLEWYDGMKFTTRDKNGNPIESHMKEVSKNEIKRRLEKLTGGEFNSEGLLPANWVNGEYGLLSIQPTRKSGTLEYRINNQEHYKIIFNNGEFINLQLVKGKTIND